MFICLNTFVETKLKIVEMSSFFGENLVLDKFGTDHWPSFRVFDDQLMHFKEMVVNHCSEFTCEFIAKRMIKIEPHTSE